MSTNVNHSYMGGSSDVNVDTISFSKDVHCLIIVSATHFIDKNGLKRLSFLNFSTSFQIVIKVGNILEKSLNKMRCIFSLNQTGGSFYDVNVNIS